MTPAREWSIGPRHHFRLEEPGVLWLKVRGETTLEDAHGTVATYRELGTRKPFVFVADITEATSLSREARRYSARHLRAEWFRDVAYIGARPGMKVLLRVRFFLLSLLRGSSARVFFFGTEAAARAWLGQGSR
ncbi:STAS/SEC14 domain-containing protein [Myxococcus sp. RHSTA-1-4]|uniref:STAS/SEC14 domain-containing protein n=1 Tax=Myxococcus sp. RHSTA-1-4 TaxID=2874601 RepID=UPI001CBA75C2|nr:STAS/SEC14 domain-containing protein [Myxococcus sp. RHSTA-1-4]MBZ4417131.1 STAS/SEC14 domain-containing protein [Myxococcus sp. RHSTA-1-4]